MAKQPKAGWHPDPSTPGRERYWDGSAWTGEARDAPPVVVRKRRGGTFVKVVLGVMLGGTLLIVGCAALVAGGLSSKQTDGITRSQFDGIDQGRSKSSIEDEFGQPENSQDFEQQIPELQDQPSRSSCIYYPEKGKAILEGDSFQLCFDDGKLTSKNAY